MCRVDHETETVLQMLRTNKNEQKKIDDKNDEDGNKNTNTKPDNRHDTELWDKDRPIFTGNEHIWLSLFNPLPTYQVYSRNAHSNCVCTLTHTAYVCMAACVYVPFGT